MSNQGIQAPAGLTTHGLLGQRYLARFIDSAIVFLTVLVVLGLTGAIKPHSIAGTLFQIGVCMILYISYGTAFESSPWQATPGKRLMGLRVYTASGNRLKTLQAAGRNLMKEGPFIVLAFLPFGGLFAFVWLCAHLYVMNRSPVYQAIHDRIARTLVAASERS